MSPRTTPHTERLVAHLTSRRAALTHAGIVTQFSKAALRAAKRDGDVTRLLSNAYVATALADDPLVRMRAVSAWLAGRGAVSGAAALALWGFTDDMPSRITVQLPPALHLEVPAWIRTVRVNNGSGIYRVNGVRVVDAPFAVVQAWNERVGGDGVGVVIEAVRRGVHRDQILAATVATKRVRARAKLTSLLALLDGGVTSYLEWLARSKVFTNALFPHLIWQHSIVCAGRTRRPDAYDAEAKIALEFDGAIAHSGDAMRRADLERDAELASIGILTLRFTMEDLLHRPAWCVARYLDARRARIGG